MESAKPIIPSSASKRRWLGQVEQIETSNIFGERRGFSATILCALDRLIVISGGSVGTTALFPVKIVLIKLVEYRNATTQISGAEEDVAYTDNNGVATFRVSHQDSVTVDITITLRLMIPVPIIARTGIGLRSYFIRKTKIHTVQA